MKVCVVMGGVSAEREVSLKTGNAVFDACSNLGFEVIQIVIKNDYKFYLKDFKNSDIVFNALHGPIGEDGIIQLWFEKNNIAYTGSGPKSSSICMDKNNSKKIIKDLGFATPKWNLFSREINYNLINYPCIVKPSSQGSTYGLSIVNNAGELNRAVNFAKKYDSDVLIEEYISGREITVGVLDGKALPIVEIKPKHGIYDYECKYKPGMSSYFCPAKFNDQITSKIKFDSELIFKALGCKGYGRIDYIIDKNMNYYFLELNTLPGMTSTSLLPIAAKALNISFNDLVYKIIKV
mgnify:FL=1